MRSVFIVKYANVKPWYVVRAIFVYDGANSDFGHIALVLKCLEHVTIAGQFKFLTFKPVYILQLQVRQIL